MDLPFCLADVRRRPSMWLPDVTFDVAVAYIMGIDAATEHSFLRAFHEWLVVKGDGGTDFHWTENVLRLAFPNVTDRRGHLHDSADQNAVIEFLFGCLEEFLDERQKPEGMRLIYLRYQEWLNRQEWYDRSSPHWIDLDLTS